jgi:hypothetical protein
MHRRAMLPLALACALAITPALPGAAQLNQPLHRDGWILAAARAPGAQGSIWRTDLWIYASSANAAVTLRFCRSGEDGSSAAEHVVSLTDGRVVMHIEDVVERFLGVGSQAWLGTIHYSSSMDIQVWARVYSISADGSRSFGQLIEGIPTAHASPDATPWESMDHQWMFAMKHTADGRFRVNIGIVNPSDVASDYWLDMYAADSSHLDSRVIPVPPLSDQQAAGEVRQPDSRAGSHSTCLVHTRGCRPCERRRHAVGFMFDPWVQVPPRLGVRWPSSCLAAG